MYAPHTVTLYNTTVETDLSTFKDTVKSYTTILRGVLVDASKAANVRESGLVGADAVTVYIPFDVDARDGLTDETKSYVEPQEFWAAADKTKLWTLSTDGNGGETFLVKGEFVSTPEVARAHDGCYSVTKVDTKDFGSADMQHWEVGGV